MKAGRIGQRLTAILVAGVLLVPASAEGKAPDRSPVAPLRAAATAPPASATLPPSVPQPAAAQTSASVPPAARPPGPAAPAPSPPAAVAAAGQAAPPPRPGVAQPAPAMTDRPAPVDAVRDAPATGVVAPVAPAVQPRARTAAAAPGQPAAPAAAGDLLEQAARRDTLRLAQAGREPPPPVAVAAATTPRPSARPGSDAGGAAAQAEGEPAGGATTAPLDIALRPQPRPEVPAGRAAPGPAASASLAARAAVAAVSTRAVAQSRIPRVRPEAQRREFLQRVAAVRTQPAPGAIAGRTTGNLCGVQGIEGSTIAPIAGRVQGCGVANPVRVTMVDGVRLSQSAVMDCDTARALHAWVRGGLRPAVGRLGGGPERLNVAGHYVCRTMNHRPGARISEHGRGRAIDISGVRLADGRTLNVLQHWRHGTYGPVLRAAHRAACGPFSTTLGPGSDGMHEDHLHFDMRQGRRLCR